MEVLTALRERRSISFFEPGREIKPSLLEELISTANLSPSSYNLQPWEVIAVASPEKKKILRACAFNQAKVEEASAVLIIVADPGAVEKHIDPVLQKQVELGYISEKDVAGSRQAPFKLYGERDSLKRKLFAVKNAAFFAMSIMAAARGLGLETHPMDGFNEEKIKDAFAIEPEKIIPVLIAAGYPAKGRHLLPRAYRRELRDFVRFE
ncbi:MAG TPA: nitroreductase family protein [Spirochaetota bacterium]|nr:nitroreductase family protein [Spirochaetota bacterium]HPI87745.1 nitroreductase family protein [Spirochaetota bacterium]HPR48130.1 nitroreductase family protein [Spirochaetota bacterium]